VPGPASTPGAKSPAPPPGPELATALRPVQHEEPSSRQAADLQQRLADTRDESKILAARLQEFQAQIDDKNRALAAARSEVRRVTDEIKQTREQIDHWSREVGNLRARAETAEKENQASLKALAQLVEMMIVQETARTGKPAAPPSSVPAVVPPVGP
jgi:chromosome segregation ATPase